MKKLIFLLLAVMVPLTFLCAQATINKTDANGHKQGRWIGKYANGTIRYEGSFNDDKPVGEWKRFHENGKIMAQLHHIPNTNRTAAELFDNDGMHYATGYYKDTLKDSTWLYFNNKRLVKQDIYSEGKKNGLSRNFFESGAPVTESNWVNGVLNGVSRSYYPSGKKKSETMYFQGKRHGLNLIYFESGQTEIIGQYADDQPEGTWKFADENGQLKYELKYKDGILLNPEVVDSIQSADFKAFDRAKGKLKDPEEFSQNPEEYMQN